MQALCLIFLLICFDRLLQYIESKNGDKRIVYFKNKKEIRARCKKKEVDDV